MGALVEITCLLHWNMEFKAVISALGYLKCLHGISLQVIQYVTVLFTGHAQVEKRRKK